MVLGLPTIGSVTLSAQALALVKTAVFLLLASLVIRYGSRSIRKASSRKFDEPVVIEFVEDLSRIFMWFWAALIALSMLGFSGIAMSMGTASGFVALGIAFALSNVISDTVAGVYLAQDKDFNSGDHVKVDSEKGVVKEVGLRKTRIELENGDLRVINNTDVEKKWTKKE